MLATFHLNLGKFLGVCGHDEFRLLLNFIGLRNFPLLSKVLPESAAGQVVNLFCYEQGQKSFVTIVKITRKNLTKNSFFMKEGGGGENPVMWNLSVIFWVIDTSH